jgi:hypothetical protein
MKLFKKNSRVLLAGSSNGVQLVFVGAGNPPDDLRGLIKFDMDEATGQRLEDVQFYYGGAYRGLFRFLDLGAMVYMVESAIDVPWEKVDGAPTVTTADGDVVLVKYVGYPNPYN